MFTAAVAEKSELPWEGLKSTGFDKFLDFLQSSAQALPYHIYTVAGRIPQSEYTQPMQYGSVLVFMLIVMSFAAMSIWLRVTGAETNSNGNPAFSRTSHEPILRPQ